MPDYRLATLADLPALVAIENAAGFNHWTETQLRDSINSHIVYVVESHAVVAGFAIFSAVLDEAELLNIAVAPQEQGKGLGKALLAYGLSILLRQGLQQCFLEVGVSNATAIHLYRQCGFQQTGLRKNYYQHVNTSEDAMVMQLGLKEMLCKS